MSKRTTDNGLRIDPEIHALIPPLLKEEREHLRESLLRDGCRDRIVAWDEEDVLLDGHNRQELCEELGIGYGIKRMSFPNRNAALAWVITNQFGRRNLSAMQRVNLALKLEPLIAAEATVRMKSGNPVVNSRQGRTDEILAETAGVSGDTIRKGRKINGHAAPEIQAMATRGEVSINAAAKVAELPKAEQKRIASNGAAAVKAKAKEAGMASPSAAPPEVLTDCEGNPLPDHKRLRAIFADAQIIKDAQAALTAFAKAKNILWASDSPAVESLKGQQQQIDSLHEQIRTKLRDYQFHAVCGDCGGKGCAMCANMGAVTRMEWGRKRNVAEARKGVA
jgi:hypothetical protein